MSAAVFLAACAVLLYTGFCRLVHTSAATALCARLAIYLLTLSAAGCAAAVLVWAYQPGWPAALLAAAMSSVQLASAGLWRDGVPQAWRTSGE